MNTLYGIRGAIKSTHINISDLIENITLGEFKILVQDNIIEVGFENFDASENAYKVARLFLHSWSLRNGSKVTADFNQSWQPQNSTGRLHKITLTDEIGISDRIVTTAKIVKSLQYVIKSRHDCNEFSNDIDMVSKAIIDSTLESALEYFCQEVLDCERPLYGVYKAIEIIKNEVGIEELAKLVGEDKKYVTDVMQSAQQTRHAVTPAKSVLSESECKSRAKILIEAYAKSL